MIVKIGDIKDLWSIGGRHDAAQDRCPLVEQSAGTGIDQNAGCGACQKLSHDQPVQLDTGQMHHAGEEIGIQRRHFEDFAPQPVSRKDLFCPLEIVGMINAQFTVQRSLQILEKVDTTRYNCEYEYPQMPLIRPPDERLFHVRAGNSIADVNESSVHCQFPSVPYSGSLTPVFVFAGFKSAVVRRGAGHVNLPMGPVIL